MAVSQGPEFTSDAQMRRSTRWLMGLLLMLMGLGVVMVASATAPSELAEGKGYATLIGHVTKVGLSLVALLFGAQLRPRWIEALAAPLWLLSLALLVTVLIVGPERNNAQRWLDLGSLSVQPSELARLAVMLAVGAWASRAGTRMSEAVHGVLVPFVLIGLPAALVLIQPDFGSTVYLLLMGVLVLWTGGARSQHLLAVFGATLALAAIYGLERFEHVARRLRGFMNPEAGGQVEQGLRALGHGHVLGRGLGQREVVVPEAENDFVLAALGEQLGLLGTVGLVALYALFLWHGLRLLMGMRTRFGLVVGAGLLLQVLVQAVLNIAVVTAVAPPKGLPLPFVSAGGTSLLVLSLSTGLFLGLARRPSENPGATTDAARARSA
ncbi:MAG: stage V sporulation protein E [Planctomycetota bacterium]|nr:MAG: stage V sporulation protein E [Planctomycetota bacterium]